MNLSHCDTSQNNFFWIWPFDGKSQISDVSTEFFVSFGSKSCVASRNYRHSRNCWPSFLRQVRADLTNDHPEKTRKKNNSPQFEVLFFESITCDDFLSDSSLNDLCRVFRGRVTWKIDHCFPADRERTDLLVFRRSLNPISSVEFLSKREVRVKWNQVSCSMMPSSVIFSWRKTTFVRSFVFSL